MKAAIMNKEIKTIEEPLLRASVCMAEWMSHHYPLVNASNSTAVTVTFHQLQDLVERYSHLIDEQEIK